MSKQINDWQKDPTYFFNLGHEIWISLDLVFHKRPIQNKVN